VLQLPRETRRVRPYDGDSSIHVQLCSALRPVRLCRSCPWRSRLFDYDDSRSRSKGRLTQTSTNSPAPRNPPLATSFISANKATTTSSLGCRSGREGVSIAQSPFKMCTSIFILLFLFFCLCTVFTHRVEWRWTLAHLHPPHLLLLPSTRSLLDSAQKKKRQNSMAVSKILSSHYPVYISY